MRSLVLVALVTSVADAAPCPSLALHAEVLTPGDAPIATGGGFIVAAVASSAAGGAVEGDVASQPTWRIRAGARTIAPGIHVVAPGLDVYDVGDVEGTVVLDGGGTKHQAVRVDKYVDLDAPVVRAVKVDDNSGSKHPYTSVAAELKSKVPAHALAVVVFGKDGARSWQAVSTGADSVYVYTSGGCAPLPNGTIATGLGDEVQLAWLADNGRLSKKSAKMKVTRAR